MGIIHEEVEEEKEPPLLNLKTLQSIFKAIYQFAEYDMTKDFKRTIW